MIVPLMLVMGLARGAAALPLPASGSPDELGFGLEKLRWGMTPQDAKGRYPALDGQPPEPGQPWAEFFINAYGYAGCPLIVKLEFESGKLARVDLDSNGTAHFKLCNDKIKAALVRQYGRDNGGFSTAANPHGYSEYGAWGGPVTEVTYSELLNAFIEVSFARTPAIGRR